MAGRLEVEDLADAPASYKEAVGAEGWIEALWEDPSGAQVVANVSRNWEVEAAPSVAGGPGTSVAYVAWVPGTWCATASVIGAEHEEMTRLCADFVQWRLLEEDGDDGLIDVALTGLVHEMSTYEDQDAFDAAPDPFFGDELPEGPDGEPVRVAHDAFIPSGMFEEIPDNRATFGGVVVSASERVNQTTGRPFRTAVVATLGGDLLVTLCWPPEVAGTLSKGNIVWCRALLTMVAPDWLPGTL